MVKTRSMSHARNRVAGPASGSENTTPSGSRMSSVWRREEVMAGNGRKRGRKSWMKNRKQRLQCKSIIRFVFL